MRDLFVHGVGLWTPGYADAAEAQAISGLLGDDVPVVSTKSRTGHLLGGCGAIEAALSVMTLETGVIPASLGADPVDPEISVFVPTEPLERPVRTVLSNAFGFGGTNATVIFGRRS